MIKALRWSASICMAIVLLGVVSIQSVQAQTKDFNVPAQSATTGIPEFARQAGIQILVSEPLVRGKRIAALTGSHTIPEALAILLKGSGLSASTKDGTTYTVAAIAEPPTTFNSTSTLGVLAASESQKAPIEDSQATKPKAELTEIIVTAQKRSERLQDVPVPVTALDANELAANQQVRLQDYFATVPGLSLGANALSGFGGAQTIAIRGITTGGAGFNPTVAVTIDDVPYGSNSSYGFGNVLYPDIDPADLARIEVLRGPQGTLYGASSIGGLIKFVTVDPSTDAYSGRVQVLGEHVQSGEFGYAVRGAVNVPLSDTLAIRASGFARRDPGYVENVITGQRYVNQADVEGGHVAALWRPSDIVSVKIGALVQNTNGSGSPTVDTDSSLQPTLGYFKHATLPGTGGYSIESRLYTASVTADLGGIDLTSVSGYGINKYSTLTDFTDNFGYFAQSIFNLPGSSESNKFETKKFTQEIRLASKHDQTVEWLVGGFYSHEHSPVDQAFLANSVPSGQQGGTIINYSEPITVTEYAAFADLTVHFTDRFDVQFGGRESWNTQSYNETDSGPLVLSFDGVPSPYVQPTENVRANSFTYLLTPQLKVSPDFMVYARLASGYRVGGPNFEAALLNVPATFAPDKTYNYELGVKADLLNHTLSLDASAYYIDWKHLQVLVLSNIDFPYNTNGGDAKSQGVELSVQSRPAQGLKVSAMATMGEAKLTQSFPASATVIGTAGDRLPYSSRFSGNLSIDQDIYQRGQFTGFVGGSLSYVGAREGEFVSSPTAQRLRFPSYAVTDVHTGARFDSWTVNLFMNNAFNRKGIVGGGINQAEAPYYATYIQPLTVGLSLSKVF